LADLESRLHRILADPAEVARIGRETLISLWAKLLAAKTAAEAEKAKMVQKKIDKSFFLLQEYDRLTTLCMEAIDETLGLEPGNLASLHHDADSRRG
jgi:hypothetical protein